MGGPPQAQVQQAFAGPPAPVFQAFHGVVSDARPDNDGINTYDNNSGGGGKEFTCTGPPTQSFEEFLNRHGRPQPQHSRISMQQQPPPVQQQQQQPDPAANNMYPGAPMYFPARPIEMPRTLDQIDYSDFIRK